MFDTPLVYPKIPGPANCPLKNCIAFNKYDGTNIHWKWDVDFGWVSFGTRRSSYDLNQDKYFIKDHPGLEKVLGAFDPIKDSLAKCLANKRIKKATVFTEYFGPRSFAGSHHPDDSMSLIIIDVMFEETMLTPELFLGEMKKQPLAEIIYKGKYNVDFIAKVKKGHFKVNEGVVCKGMVKDKIYMTKIKTNSYLQRLKNEFGKDSWKEFWE